MAYGIKYNFDFSNELDEVYILTFEFLNFVGTPVNINNYRSICQSARGSSEEFWNVAFVKAFIGNEELKCQQRFRTADEATGEIKFRDKKDSIKCALETQIKKSSDAYTTPIKVEVNYGYIETFVTLFTISGSRN